MYMIKASNGQYIKKLSHGEKGGWKLTDDINEANQWAKVEKARNVVNMMLKSSKTYGDMEFEIELVIEEGKKIIDMPLTSTESFNFTQNTMDVANTLVDYVKSLEQRKNELAAQLKQADLECIDLEHAIEFYTLNARDGYKLYKQFHDLRLRRRAIKDELLLLGNLVSSINVDAVLNLEKQMKGLEDRKYTPRTDIKLFA